MDTQTLSQGINKLLIKIVEEKAPIKVTDLAIDFLIAYRETPELIASEITAEAFHIHLANLVANGDIVEVEYILPTMNYRIKSLYFPKGTDVNLVKSNND